MKTRDSTPEVMWRRIGFEESMQMFYAASDLVVARAGGAVAELIATATPGILVPGEFGSSGHQKGNARFLTEAGATVTVFEPELAKLADLVRDTLFEPQALSRMRIAAEGIARPEAAHTVARAMMEVSD
jgi:UDP-N-acetylglucosamine--N-acetylmuramyl-(pentapeptide) pyrophosphoryl-undecaprenol N-acetylglucosamine transferase